MHAFTEILKDIIITCAQTGFVFKRNGNNKCWYFVLVFNIGNIMDTIDDFDKINNMMKYIITLLMKFLLTCTVHVINDYYKYAYCNA